MIYANEIKKMIFFVGVVSGCGEYWISPKLSKMIQKLWKIMIAGQLVGFRPKEADLGRIRQDEGRSKAIQE